MDMKTLVSLTLGLVPLVASAVKWMVSRRFSRAAAMVERADLCRRLGLDEQAAAAESAARAGLLRPVVVRERRIGRFLRLSRWDALAVASWGTGAALTYFTVRTDGAVQGVWAAVQVLLGCLAYWALSRETTAVEKRVVTEAKKAASMVAARAATGSAPAPTQGRAGRFSRALRELTRK